MLRPCARVAGPGTLAGPAVPDKPLGPRSEPSFTDHSLTPSLPPRGARPDPLVGKVIDNRYRLLSLLARGGMGKVYRAEQAQLRRVVAVKLMELGKNGEHDEEFRRRFMLEAATYARLAHPNTVRIFDYGNTWDDILYIAMEFLDGRTLHSVIKTEAPLRAERILSIAKQVCGSLREAHGHGLVHRDLKPSNIVLLRHAEGEDFVKVLDFGLVKELRSDNELTSGEAVVGSPSYMAPEQIRAERLDGRTDIYAVGVILYACVAGRTPFVGENSMSVLLAHLNQAPPPLPADAPALLDCPLLAWLIETCLQKDRNLRFADVDELVRGLRLCEIATRGELVTPPTLESGRIVGGERTPPPAPRGAAEPAEPAELPLPNETSISTFVTGIVSRRGPLLAVGSAMLLMVMLGVLALGAGAWLYLRADAPVLGHDGGGGAEAGRVRVTTVPPRATISRGSVVLGDAPLSLDVPSGEAWEITVSAPQFEPRTVRVTAAEERVSVVLRRASDLPAAPPAPVESTAPAASRAAPTHGGAQRAQPRTADAPPGPAASPQPASAAPPPRAPAPEPAPQGDNRKSSPSDLRDPWSR